MIPLAKLVRWVLFALLAAAVGGALLLALLTVDTALSVWQRLQELPAGFRYLYIALLAAAGAAIAWLAWRLLSRRRRGRARAKVEEPVTRERIQQRAARLLELEAPLPEVDAELAELDRRAASGELYVAMFGAINAGKSALIRALAPQAGAASDVIGGTTREVRHYEGTLDDGRRLQLADVPGSQEDPGREALAREEVLRAHWVLYVCSGDLTRSEAAEVAGLRGSGKPFLLVLNQADRYGGDEQRQLMARLHERTGAEVVLASAGGVEEVEVETPDGNVLQRRARPPQVDALRARLSRHLAPGAAAFEAARQQAVLRGLDRRLEEAEARRRAEVADAVIGRYTRRAVVGALAAVAPGSDLVIQGALGTGLVRELATLYDTPVRQIDIDALVDRAGRTLRTTTAVVLAIAGNAAKAFPGLGTLGGGLAHAVAYGMIFDSLGRAVAQVLAESGRLDSEAAAEAFAERLRQVPAPKALGVLRDVVAETVHPGREGKHG